jgi:hypothetical protein
MTNLVSQEVRRLPVASLVVFVLLSTWVAADLAITAMTAGHGSVGVLLHPPPHLPAFAAAQLQSERPMLLREVAAARLTEGPLGAGVFAVGLVGSLPGLALALWLAANSVASEWGRRTWRTVLTQDASRARVLASKMAACWLVTLGLMLVVWAFVAIVLSVARSRYPIPASLHGGEAPGDVSTLLTIGSSLLVVAGFVALSTLLAVVCRNMLGTFLAGALLTGLGFAGTGVPAVARFDPVRFVTGALGLGGMPGTPTTGIWPSSFPGLGVPSAGPASLVVALAAFVLAYGAFAAFLRCDIS